MSVDARPGGESPADPEPAPAKPGQVQSDHRHMSVRQHLVLDTSIIVGVALAWILLILSYHWFAQPPLPKVDPHTTAETVVVLHLQDLNTTEQRLGMKVLLKPDATILNPRLHRLTADTAVRFPSQEDLGELQYPKDQAPQPYDATVEARGDPLHWPFDTYTTDPIRVQWLAGAGESLHYENARVEVDGVVDGFDVSLERVGDDPNDPADAVIIKLSRATGPLFFDIGICLVLITLPALAMFVAIQMVTQRRAFVPPFGTWYAAMLFAVVPLRNFLPGSPPTGAWIDQGLVIWVLLGLAAAMVIYIVAWYRDKN
ncbi:DUF4436 domain-containing protein [Mycobacterium intermedium]|uniref:DUF4436 domain-containing protein n=1 Tax=Mycobacterium intermedium TaxID=28445 RepID=UPI001E5BE5A6|nr:DUF4436 domain-containing protein [Mycobacterium intermedium]